MSDPHVRRRRRRPPLRPTRGAPAPLDAPRGALPGPPATWSSWRSRGFPVARRRDAATRARRERHHAPVDRRCVRARLRRLASHGGRAGDRFGRKGALLVGLAVFATGLRDQWSRRIGHRRHRRAGGAGSRRGLCEDAGHALADHRDLPSGGAAGAIAAWSGSPGPEPRSVRSCPVPCSSASGGARRSS